MILLSAKTRKNNSKINEMQIERIQIKSPLKKTSYFEPRVSSKIERYKNSKSICILRKDSRGVPIIKGHKNHKISFADNLYGSNLAIIINIESFKHYNSIEVEIDVPELKKKDKFSCKCSIL